MFQNCFEKNHLNQLLEFFSKIIKTYNLHKKLFSIYQNIHTQDTFPSFPFLDIVEHESLFSSDQWEEQKQACLTLLQYSARFQLFFTSIAFVQFFNQVNTDYNNSKDNQPLFDLNENSSHFSTFFDQNIESLLRPLK